MTESRVKDTSPSNGYIARLLRDLADHLEIQNANRYRVQAYRHAADVVENHRDSIAAVAGQNPAALEELPGIGASIAAAIKVIGSTGKLPLLNKLTGEASSEWLLQGIPTIGSHMAHRLHDELGIESFDDLQQAVQSGRISTMRGLGAKRVRAISEFLQSRQHRLPPKAEYGDAMLAHQREPDVAELLDVDQEYRQSAQSGKLPRIAPRRFNPSAAAWLPILHAERGERHYTALFSNTAHANELGMTHDWVVIYADDAASQPHRHQWTVITAQYGKHRGLRIVRGREWECDQYYAKQRLKGLLDRLKRSAKQEPPKKPL